MMPWQLREGLKRRPKNAPPRPIAEQLPSISVNELPIPYYYDEKTYIIRSLKWSCIASIKVSRDQVSFYLPSLHRGQIGPNQVFRLKHIRTGFGLRHAFICCDCGRPVIKVYHQHRHLACRRCQHAIYASQNLGKHTRPILQVSRIASFLDSKSRLYRRSRERLRKKLGDKLMMAQGRLGTEARSLWE
jgi:hypothetical protein